MKTMQLCMILTFLGVAVLSDASQPAPKGLDFVGVGYNLLKGNPEGGDLSIGGIDPGLLTTRKIFKLTYKTGKTSSDRKYSIPDQVSFAHRSSCVLETKKEVVFGSRSYQKKLESDVEASGKDKKGVGRATEPLKGVGGNAQERRIKERVQQQPKCCLIIFKPCESSRHTTQLRWPCQNLTYVHSLINQLVAAMHGESVKKICACTRY